MINDNSSHSAAVVLAMEAALQVEKAPSWTPGQSLSLTDGQ